MVKYYIFLIIIMTNVLYPIVIVEEKVNKKSIYEWQTIEYSLLFTGDAGKFKVEGLNENAISDFEVVNKKIESETIHKDNEISTMNYKITYTDDFVFIYSLEDLGLSRKSKDISKDFIFSMNFQGKSFWEKMNLLYMLNQGLRLYPEHKRMLYMRYSSVMWMTYIESLVWFMGRSYRKLRRTLRIK